jgi:TusE/DsrC/DsvC family sulfur relay protein
MGYSNVGLKEKIMEMYPEIYQHGILVGLEFSKEKYAYIVTFRKGARVLSTHLEKKDADECMDGKKCIYLGVQIGQFIKNFEGDRPPASEIRVLTSCGTSVRVDDEGYLLNFHDWNETAAAALAEKEGITSLSKEHMAILKFIRDHYEQYNYFPIVRAVCRNLHQEDACVAEKFMNPIVAWKIAGLPKPDVVVLNLLEHNEPPT